MTDMSGTRTYSAPERTGSRPAVEQPDSLSPMAGVQHFFAQLQMNQAKVCKSAAHEKMHELRDIQEDQKKLCSFCAVAGAGSRGQSVTAKKEMFQLCKKYDIPLLDWKCTDPCKDRTYRKEEWEIVVKALSGFKEQLNARTQSIITVLQDFMGQYNSYLDGARTATAKSTALINKLTTNRQ